MASLARAWQSVVASEARQSHPVDVIASVAWQSHRKKGRDCFVTSFLAMTAYFMRSHSLFRAKRRNLLRSSR